MVEDLDADDNDARHGPIAVGVLPRNMGVVAVFRRCQPQIAVGMGVLWQGVCAREVLAACLMSRTPRADWCRYLDGVQRMAQVVASIRNADRTHHQQARGTK